MSIIKPECCFKIAKYGSIIHDRIDYDTWQLEKYGKFVKTSHMAKPDGVIYDKRKYDGSLQDHAATCEAFMLRDKNIFMCVEVVNKWYMMYTHDNDALTYTDLEAGPNEAGVCYSDMFDIENVYYVGTELVDSYTIRYCPWTYRICLKDGYIFTSKGIFECPIPISELTGYRPELTKYLEMRYQKKYFGYLFIKDGYLLLYLNEDGSIGWEVAK